MVAVQAADAFRHGGYESVSQVVLAFVQTHYGPGQFQGMSEKDIRETGAFRQFREYVFEELEKGPQTLRIRFKILGIRRRNRRKQTRDVGPEVSLQPQRVLNQAFQDGDGALCESLRLSDQIRVMQHQLLSAAWIRSELSKMRQWRLGMTLAEHAKFNRDKSAL